MERQRSESVDSGESEILDFRSEIEDLRVLNADQQLELNALRKDKEELAQALAQLQVGYALLSLVIDW